MKRRILLLVLIFFLVSKTNAQIRDSSINKNKVNADLLFKKANKAKTGGIILLLTGAAITTTGLIVSKNNSLSGAAIEIIGVATALLSVPAFIGSAHYKKKAGISFKYEPLSEILKSKASLISVSINIKFK
jgi:hypothetical protein